MAPRAAVSCSELQPFCVGSIGLFHAADLQSSNGNNSGIASGENPLKVPKCGAQAKLFEWSLNGGFMFCGEVEPND